MYIVKNKFDSIEKYRRAYCLDTEFYNDLISHQYLIVYSFNTVTEGIVYKAISKSEKKSKRRSLVTIEVLPNGELAKGNDSYIELQKTLYFYILVKDKSKSKEEIGSVYNPLSEYIYDEDDGVNYEDRIAIRQLLSDLAEDIRFESVNEVNDDSEKGTINIEISIEQEAKDFYLSLKLGKNKMYNIRSISEFLGCVKSETYHRYGAELEFVHKLSAFSDKSQKIISLLSKLYMYEYDKKNDNRMRIYTAGIIEMLTLLKDGYLFFNDEWIYVEPEIVKASVEIEDDTTIKLCPELDGSLYSDKNRGFVVSNSSIKLVEFKNIATQKLYSFKKSHKDLSLKPAKDILFSKIVPCLDNNSNQLANLAKENRGNILDIQVFIEFNENDEIIISTKYQLGNGKIKERYELMQDYLYKNRLYAFDNILQQLNIEENCIITDSDEVCRFLQTDLEPLKQVATVMISESLKQKQIVLAPQIKVRAGYGIDWVDLEVESDNYSAKQINDIFIAYSLKKKFYRMGDQIILLEEEDPSLMLLESLKRDFKLDKDLKAEKLPLYEAFKINGIDDKAEINEKLRDVFNAVKNYQNKELTVDKRLAETLRPYQLDAVKWMDTLYRFGLCGILADDMGLGKTLEMITFITLLKEEPILIVSPKSLLYNWKSEFEKFAPFVNVEIIQGLKDQREEKIKLIKLDKKVVYITSYDSIRNDVDMYENLTFGLIVLDEGQYIKNAYAQKTKAIKGLKSNARFVLTGTPIENYLSDLWSIFDFLMPNYLLSYDKFRKEYENMIVTEKDRISKEKLVAKIKPFILRRTKKEVLKDLPPKTEVNYVIDMGDKQRELYDVWLEKAKKSLKEEKHNKIEMLSLITRLRQICVDPSMFIDNFNDLSEKLNMAISLIQEAIENGHKVILFSSFTKSLEHLRELLADKGITSYYINGEVPAKTRLEIADNFNTKDDVKVTLVSLKAGGTGLNLIGADIVIHIDPWWNLAAENQASDRAYRIGQTNPVTVIKMICKNSVEEKVVSLQEVKHGLVDDIIENKESLDDKALQYILD